MRQKMHINITITGGDCPCTFELKGRLGWAMAQFADAGPDGITPSERPAPRWSGYVHELRGTGIPIHSEWVNHGRAYSGHHARYRLACDVSLMVLDGEAVT
jgi:winged helix domain-containing protein